MDLNTITTQDFKTRFHRNFNYTNVSDPDYVGNQDITNAFGEAKITFNQTLFGNDDDITLAYLYLTAHFMCVDIAMANGGVNSQANFPVSARTVGSVSESYAVPEAYTQSANLSYYTQTAYGLKYLAMVLPRLVGNFGHVYGGTTP